MYQEKQHSIYAILCPKTKAVRYVGCTSKEDVRLRVLEHFNSINEDFKQWLKGLGQPPLVVILDTCNKYRHSAVEIENKWIKRFTAEGHQLFNKRGLTVRRHPIMQVPVIDLCGKLNGTKSIKKILEEKKQSA